MWDDIKLSATRYSHETGIGGGRKSKIGGRRAIGAMEGEALRRIIDHREGKSMENIRTGRDSVSLRSPQSQATTGTHASGAAIFWPRLLVAPVPRHRERPFLTSGVAHPAIAGDHCSALASGGWIPERPMPHPRAALGRLFSQSAIAHHAGAYQGLTVRKLLVTQANSTSSEMRSTRTMTRAGGITSSAVRESECRAALICRSSCPHRSPRAIGGSCRTTSCCSNG